MKREKKPRRELSEERGEYRPIYTVLIHGPDYQALSPTEKLVLLHLKLNLGPAGIGILYPAVLAEQTGYSEEQTRLAIDILSHRGWVSHERNVFWVVDGLKYEPSLSKKNDNHKGWLSRYVRGLPKLLVVKQFCDRYCEWLPRGGGWDGDGITVPMPITSTSTTTETNNTPASQEAPRRVGAKYPHFPTPVCQGLYAVWIPARGGVKYSAFREALAPFWPAPSPIYTEQEWLDAIKCFAEVAGSQNPKESHWWTIHKLTGDAATWIRLGKMPNQLPSGELTERGRLIAA